MKGTHVELHCPFCGAYNVTCRNGQCGGDYYVSETYSCQNVPECGKLFSVPEFEYQGDNSDG